MKYWNAYTETLPTEELDRIEFGFFKEYFAYAKANSAMYREKLKGINAEDIKSIEDIRKIPFTYKDELRAQQEVEFPYGALLGVPIEQVSVQADERNTESLSTYPRATRAGSGGRIVVSHPLMAGFRPHHRVFLPVGYNVYVAFWECHYACEKVGCRLSREAPDTKGRVNKILEIKRSHGMHPTWPQHR
jgi:phenylacetate-CoA ligase